MIQSPAARRAIPLLADQLGPDVARTVIELLDDAGLLARPTARVGGPYPITVRRAGIGVEIDHHVMMTAHLAQLADDPARTAFRLEEIEAASRRTATRCWTPCSPTSAARSRY